MPFPKQFIERLHNQISESTLLLDALNESPTLSIRYNPSKHAISPLENQVPWCPNGEYLNERPKFSLDPLWHAGNYYVQEASSMFIDYILCELKKKSFSLDACLDFCAAPGGKSTLLLSHLKSNQVLIANEVIDKRNAILRENLTKWGMPNFIVTKSESNNWKNYTNSLDLILIDAPCSGEGMFRKDLNARNEWNENNIALCETRQKAILDDLWPSLKPGGVLIYSTCTFNPGENENQLSAFEKEHTFDSLKLAFPDEWEIIEKNSEGIISYHFYPHKTKGEGFFCSVLVKEKDAQLCQKTTPIQKSILEDNELLSYFEESHHHELSKIENKNSVFVSTKNTIQKTQELRLNKIFIKQVGIECFEKNRNGLQISHGLSMIQFFKKDFFPKIELTLEQALKFLSKNYLELKGYPNGIHLVQYKNRNLGFIKIIDYRINNYYPTEWRIIKI